MKIRKNITIDEETWFLLVRFSNGHSDGTAIKAALIKCDEIGYKPFGSPEWDMNNQAEINRDAQKGI